LELRVAEQALTDASDAIGRIEGAGDMYWLQVRLRLLRSAAEIGAMGKKILSRGCTGVDMGHGTDRTVIVPVGGYDASAADLETEHHMPHGKEDDSGY